MKTCSDICIYYIKTKNKTRRIVSYNSDVCELRICHQRINTFLQERFIPSIFSKGYVPGRSIYHNALSHMYNDYFIMLDIKNFFLRICHGQLAKKIYHEININDVEQISRKECNDIVELCSISSRGIPLGFITSPILSNIYLKEFDCIFYGKLKKLHLDNIIYTRYADDITVSFKYPDKDKNIELEQLIINLASNILSRYGLRLNNKKIRSYNLNVSNHVKVTGVNIVKQENTNLRKLSVGRETKNKLFWECMKCINTKDLEQIKRIKGLQSFILSIEKKDYESSYSSAMMKQIYSLGFNSLKDLIDSL